MSRSHQIIADLLGEFYQLAYDEPSHLLAEQCRILARVIRDAHKFVFNFEVDRNLAKFTAEALQEGMMTFPYHTTLFEYITAESDGSENVRAATLVQTAVADPNPEYKFMITVFWAASRNGWRWVPAATFEIVSIPELAVVGSHAYRHVGIREGRVTADSMLKQAMGDVYYTFAYLGALSSKSTATETVERPDRLNKKRAIQGREPLSEHKVVKLVVPRSATAGVGGVQEMMRKSPIIHWRRGHVRHYSSGAKALIAPMIVGAGEDAPTLRPREYHVVKPGKSPAG